MMTKWEIALQRKKHGHAHEHAHIKYTQSTVKIHDQFQSIISIFNIFIRFRNGFCCHCRCCWCQFFDRSNHATGVKIQEQNGESKRYIFLPFSNEMIENQVIAQMTTIKRCMKLHRIISWRIILYIEEIKFHLQTEIECYNFYF